MIRKFNSKQTIKAVLAGGLCLLATTAAFFITAGGWRFVMEALDLDHLIRYSWLFGIVFLIVSWGSGFSLWRRGFGHQDFLESPFASSFDCSSGSGVWANYELAEARGCSYLLSQLALASPLQGLKVYDLLRSRIDDSKVLRAELKMLLDEIRQHGKWHKLEDYPGRELKVLYLARMQKIDYSGRRGAIRIADDD